MHPTVGAQHVASIDMANGLWRHGVGFPCVFGDVCASSASGSLGWTELLDPDFWTELLEAWRCSAKANGSLRE